MGQPHQELKELYFSHHEVVLEVSGLFDNSHLAHAKAVLDIWFTIVQSTILTDELDDILEHRLSLSWRLVHRPQFENRLFVCLDYIVYIECPDSIVPEVLPGLE